MGKSLFLFLGRLRYLFLVFLHFSPEIVEANEPSLFPPTDDPDQLVSALRAGEVEGRQPGRVRPVDLQPGVGEEETDQVGVAALDCQVEQRLAGLANIWVSASLLQEGRHCFNVSLPAGSEDWLALATTHHKHLQTFSELAVSESVTNIHLLCRGELHCSMSNTANIISGYLISNINSNTGK